MAITVEEVRWAYRLFLDREPESDDVVKRHLEAANLQELRSHFLGSEEFRNRNGGIPVTGKYLDDLEEPVEVDANEAQLAEMMEGISREWTKFGIEEPHWSVLVGPQFRKDRIADHTDEFYASGLQDVRQLLAAVRRSRPDKVHFNKVMDFGCGVGRLSLAMAPHADALTGVDISLPHIKLAQERARQINQANADFKVIHGVSDLSAHSGYDLIFSLIVLQHNPPPVMAKLFEALLGALRPGGIAVIQIPTFLKDRPFSIGRYLAETQPPMEMNALPQRYVFRIIEEANCRLLEVREDGRIGLEPGISQQFVVEARN